MNLSFASLPYKLIALGAVIAALGAFHYLDKYNALEQQENAFKARLELSIAKAKEEARDTEKKLALSVIEGEQKKNEKLQDINNKLVSSINSLSKRPQRPTDNSPASSVVQACTGRELYREDGEFLIREAARADQVVVERNYYYEQYESARALLAKQRSND